VTPGSSPPTRRSRGTPALVVSVLLAVAASGVCLFAPTGSVASGEAVISRPAGASGISVSERKTEDLERTTLVEEQPEAIIPIAGLALTLAVVPLLLNGTALRRPSRTICAALLVVGSLLAGFSVGLLYLPSALSMTVAAARG
jgi:hypothetical protein